MTKPALVVELKYDRTAYAAIQQIKDRHYAQALEGYVGEVLLVGINYDKEKKDKPHSCVIEKFNNYNIKEEIKVAGAKYCDCPACAACEAILEKKDEMR